MLSTPELHTRQVAIFAQFAISLTVMGNSLTLRCSFSEPIWLVLSCTCSRSRRLKLSLDVSDSRHIGPTLRRAAPRQRGAGSGWAPPAQEKCESAADGPSHCVMTRLRGVAVQRLRVPGQ